MKIAFVSVLLAVSLPMSVTVSTAFAQEAALALKPAAEMRDVLTDHLDKRVSIQLAAGDAIEGTVASVGKSLVHISRLSGKEFYDSVVSIDRISAVRIKVRER